MSLPVIKNPNDFPFKHSGQPDAYGQSVGGNFATVQASFDSRAEFNQTQINGVITALNSITLGDDGAGVVKVNRPTVTATDVGGALEELKTDIANAMIEVLPEKSVTYPYLGDDVKTRMAYTDKAVAEMQMFFELAGRMPSPNNNKFYTDFINTFTASMGTVDATSQVYTGTLSSGATSVTVTSATGFAQGQEISIQDAVGYEDVLILSVVGNVITFKTALVNTYTNPRIYRSNNNGINFGTGGTTATVYDRTTPVQVVNSAYTTSASARPQVLSNGWIVTAVNDQSGLAIKVYVSKDNMATTPVHIGNMAYSSSTPFWSMTSYGNTVYLVQAINDTTFRVKVITDFTTTGQSFGTGAVNIDTAQTAFSGCSLAISSTGTLTAAWSSKNATYPNSFNIRSAKSTDGGVTWTKQDGTAGIDQLTSANTTGADYTEPCIVYMSNGRPIAVFRLANATNRDIVSEYFNGTSWVLSNIYQVNNASYTQSSPSATVQKYGANVGRIEVVWDGLDATDTTQRNIRYSYSDDNGVTWSAMLKLTSGNTYGQSEACVSVDLTGDVWVTFRGNLVGKTYTQLKNLKKTSGIWGSVNVITDDLTANTGLQPSTCDNYYNFEKPLTVWRTSTDVKFYGKWTVGSDNNVLKNVIRMNIRPYLASKYIQTWLTKSEITGFNVDGKASFRATTTADEVYIDLTETTTDLGSTNEISMSGINATAQSFITLKLILNRASTGDNAQSTRLIGGVSA